MYFMPLMSWNRKRLVKSTRTECACCELHFVPRWSEEYELNCFFRIVLSCSQSRISIWSESMLRRQQTDGKTNELCKYMHEGKDVLIFLHVVFSFVVSLVHWNSAILTGYMLKCLGLTPSHTTVYGDSFFSDDLHLLLKECVVYNMTWCVWHLNPSCMVVHDADVDQTPPALPHNLCAEDKCVNNSSFYFQLMTVNPFIYSLKTFPLYIYIRLPSVYTLRLYITIIQM